MRPYRGRHKRRGYARNGGTDEKLGTNVFPKINGRGELNTQMCSILRFKTVIA